MKNLISFALIAITLSACLPVGAAQFRLPEELRESTGLDRLIIAPGGIQIH